VETAGQRALYIYGVIPSGQSFSTAVGAAVEAIEHSTLAALVEPVCAREFSPDTLEEKLASIEWVAGLAHKHEAVLEDAMRHGTVVPARLCTLFTSAEALRLSLATHEDRFLAALDRMRGRGEWGVKMFCKESLLQAAGGQRDPQVQALAAAIAEASPGQAFFLRKKRDIRSAAVATARIDQVVDETIDALEPETVDMKLLRAPLSGMTRGRDEPLCLNVAALVDAAAREAFHAAVARLSERFQEEGFAFEVSGPWPPYNFCADDETGLFGSAAGPTYRGQEV
jgi:gas vesicle protein GvpL/GvpF